MGIKENYQQSLGRHRQLSGERLATAKRVFIEDIIVMLIAIIIVSILAEKNKSMAGEFYLIVLALIVVLILVRIARGETYPQLRLKEVKASRTHANEALRDLNQFAEKLKNTNVNGR